MDLHKKMEAEDVHVMQLFMMHGHQAALEEGSGIEERMKADEGPDLLKVCMCKK